jgi:hypothetical protein
MSKEARGFGLHDFKHPDDLALEDKAGGGRGVMQCRISIAACG